jgi:hypothetical protein
MLLHAMCKEGLLIAKTKDNTLIRASDNVDDMYASSELIFETLQHDGKLVFIYLYLCMYYWLLFYFFNNVYQEQS